MLINVIVGLDLEFGNSLLLILVMVQHVMHINVYTNLDQNMIQAINNVII